MAATGGRKPVSRGVPAIGIHRATVRARKPNHPRKPAREGSLWRRSGRVPPSPRRPCQAQPWQLLPRTPSRQHQRQVYRRSLLFPPTLSRTPALPSWRRYVRLPQRTRPCRGQIAAARRADRRGGPKEKPRGWRGFISGRPPRAEVGGVRLSSTIAYRRRRRCDGHHVLVGANMKASWNRISVVR